MRAIGRVFSALDCFTTGQPTLSLQEISTRVGLAKSTTFRLVHTLEQFGYLVRLADQRYSLSLKVCRLASVARGSIHVRELARPTLEGLARMTGERASLHVLTGDGRSCIDIAGGAGGAAPVIRPDRAMPFGMGADSLVLMAYMHHAARARLLPCVAQSTCCPLDELRSILDNVRSDGWAVSHGGAVAGASGIAAPILGPEGEARFCVAVTVPTMRVRGRVGTFSRMVRKAATEISVRLGATDAAVPATVAEPGAMRFRIDDLSTHQRSETAQP